MPIILSKKNTSQKCVNLTLIFNFLCYGLNKTKRTFKNEYKSVLDNKNADFYFKTFPAPGFRSLAHFYWPVWPSVMFSSGRGLLGLSSSRSRRVHCRCRMDRGYSSGEWFILYFFLYYTHILPSYFCHCIIHLSCVYERIRWIESARNGAGFCEARNLCLHFTLFVFL